MGNRSSRKDAYRPESGLSRESAYLDAQPDGDRRRQSNDDGSLDPAVVGMLKSENMEGIAGQLRRFSNRFRGDRLTVEALATFDRADLDGSGLTPLQRRRLIRAADRASRNRRPGRSKSAEVNRGPGTSVAPAWAVHRPSTCVDAIAEVTRKFSTTVDTIDEADGEVAFGVTSLPMSLKSSELPPGYLVVAPSPVPQAPDDGTYVEFRSDAVDGTGSGLALDDGTYIEFGSQHNGDDDSKCLPWLPGTGNGLSLDDGTYMEFGSPPNGPPLPPKKGERVVDNGYDCVVSALIDGKDNNGTNGVCVDPFCGSANEENCYMKAADLEETREDSYTDNAIDRGDETNAVAYTSNDNGVDSGSDLFDGSKGPPLPPKKGRSRKEDNHDSSSKKPDNNFLQTSGLCYSPVHFVLGTMRAAMDNQDTQFSACRTLSGLAKQKKENAEQAHEEGAIPVLTEILRIHSSMETVVEQALRSIARICYSVPAAVDDIVMGGEDIKEILDLMTLHQDSAAVQRASCLLIYALAYKDLTGRKALIKFGAIKQILVILENFLENPLALMMAYSVLACLSAQTWNAKVEIVEEEGLLSIAVGMNSHLSEAKMQMYGCAAIANITFGNCVTANKAVEDGVLQLVLGVLLEHSDNKRVLLYGLKALGSLAVADDAWSYMLDSGVVSIVMNACLKFTANADLHVWSCYVLTLISEKGTGKARSQLVEESIVDWCLKVMSFHEEGTEAHSAAKTLLHGFPPYNLFSVKRSASQGSFA